MNTVINVAFIVLIPRVREQQLFVAISDFEREA
jgi:hypothetical protein